jgi:hypothetical protein
MCYVERARLPRCGPASAGRKRETFRLRDGDDRLLTLPSHLSSSKRRGDISRGTAPLQPECPPTCREDTFPAVRVFRPSTAGREETGPLREIEAKIGRHLFEGASSLRAKTFFPLTAPGAKITASSAK